MVRCENVRKNDLKKIIKKIQTSSEKADSNAKKTWKELAERARKLAKKINRSWTELVKEPQTPPYDS